MDSHDMLASSRRCSDDSESKAIRSYLPWVCSPPARRTRWPVRPGIQANSPNILSPMILVLALLIWMGTPTVWSLAQTPEKKEGSTSVAGRVTIGDKPVPGVLVTLRGAYHYGSSDPVPSGKTDDEGKYKIENVHPGDYVVLAAAPALIVTENVDPFTKHVLVHLGEGESREGIDLKLAKGGVIAGKVTTSEGWPLIGVEVSVQPVSQGGSSAERTFTTDDRGEYRVFGVAPGRYRVSTSLRIAGLMTAYHPGVAQESEAVPVEVSPGAEVTGIDIVFGKSPATYSISGIVLDAATRRPVSRIQLTSGRDTPYIWVAPADEGGRFRVSTVPPGKYTIAVSLGDKSGYYCDPFPVEVVDQDLAGIEILARPAGQVTGQMDFEDGLHTELFRQPNFISLALMTVPDRQTRYSSGIVAKLDPNGGFSFTSYPPGAYHFSLSSALQPGAQIVIRRLERNGTTIPNELTLGPGEQVSGVRVVLAYGAGVIRGQVLVDDMNGAVPSSLVLSVNVGEAGPNGRPVSARQERTSPDGTFFIDGIVPDTYLVWVSGIVTLSSGRQMRVAWSSSQTSVTISNDKAQDIVLRIPQLPNR